MKIRFAIDNFPNERSKGWDFCQPLSVKISKLVFEVPFVPLQGWKVDIEPFLENDYSLTNEEKEFLFHDPFYTVGEIYMNPDFLEVQLI